MNGLALFAGVGGLELGIQLALPSSRTVCYVEGEAYASSVLVSQMAKGRLHEAPIWSDVVTFDGEPWLGKVDFISAGFPCQPWSKAGKLEKTDDERWLWDDILRIICEVRPQYIFLENVPGIINGGISHILEGLAKVGFNVEWDLLRASEVGANHQRQRAFIFAYCAERGCQLSHAMHNRFNGQWEHQENGSQGIIEGGPLERFEFASSGQDVPDSDPRLRTREEQKISSRGNFSSSSGSDVPDSNSERFQRREKKGDSFEIKKGCIKFPSRLPDYGRPEWWQIEPPVGRVVDGLAYRVDRLRACGNGVVPLQAAVAYSELIKRAEGGLNC